MTLRGFFRFLGGVEFQATTVAAPNLSGLAKAVDALPEEERARHYAKFLDDPTWVGESSNGESGLSIGGGQDGFAGNKLAESGG